jgi:hypothetical protein
LVALGVALPVALGVGLAEGEAAIAEVVPKVRIEIKNNAINFFNLCST